MPAVLPDAAEYASLVPQPGSPVRRYASDIRVLGAAGYALVLQVAHPTVGAGVAEHSRFRQDPWARLGRTLDYVHGTIYGGPRLAGELGRSVRELHRGIKGVRTDGAPYHALEPRAYAWVHATLARAIVDAHETFGSGISADELDRFWADWRRLGRLIGVRPRDLPADWTAFGDYFDEIVDGALTENPTVHAVLETLRRPPPPFAALPRPLWTLVRLPVGMQLQLITAGLLPPGLRARLRLRWTPADDAAFRVLAAASRLGSPLVFGPLRELGPGYVAGRRSVMAAARRQQAAVSADRQGHQSAAGGAPSGRVDAVLPQVLEVEGP
jgi:uncharacterized protein (DUF2236 family)